MGVIIKSSSVFMNGINSSIALAARAGGDCIEKSGVAGNDIDLLIYAGVFRDDNIIEPAMAPLIQKRLGLNNDPVGGGDPRPFTFSFDVLNGPCGFLSAARVAEAYLMSGAAKNALIVSADAHPSKKERPEFPFRAVGSAILLSRTDERGRGFKNFMFKTSGNGYLGFVAKAEIDRFGSGGRSYMNFIIEDNYHDELVDFTVTSVREYIHRHGIDPRELDLLLTTQQFKSFGKTISNAIGMNGRSRVMELHEEYGDPHSSSLGIGYHVAVEKGLLNKNQKALFVASGSGLTSACALYVA